MIRSTKLEPGVQHQQQVAGLDHWPLNDQHGREAADATPG
jgi:hypothetical protein